MIASKKRDTKIVELLLEKGAQVDLQNKDGWSALMSASKGGSVDIIQLLLKKGAKINLRNSNGLSALKIARHTEVIKLLQSGAQFD